MNALEISPTRIETIKNKKIDQLAERRLFDVYDIPHENKKFDLVILSHVLEHVEHHGKILYEAARVSRYVFIEDPLEETARMNQDFDFDRVGHINVFTP